MACREEKAGVGGAGGGPARRPVPDAETSIVASALFKLLPVFSLGGLQTSLLVGGVGGERLLIVAAVTQVDVQQAQAVDDV